MLCWVRWMKPWGSFLLCIYLSYAMYGWNWQAHMLTGSLRHSRFLLFDLRGSIWYSRVRWNGVGMVDLFQLIHNYNNPTAADDDRPGDAFVLQKCGDSSCCSIHSMLDTPHYRSKVVCLSYSNKYNQAELPPPSE